jgi:lauroyl/myristoyl acyltransferase
MAESQVRAFFDRDTSEEQRAALYFAAFRRRQGFSPAIRVTGIGTLKRAAARGRGVMLWFDDFALSSIVGKRAIAEAGYDMWYLSGYAHGFSYTRFASRFLNWRIIDLESRYVAGRIVFDEGTAAIATRRIVEILDRNGVVGIANNAVMGKTITVPLARDAQLTLARAPLSIAARRGAALIPVAVIEVEPFVAFEVRIGPEIIAHDSGDRVSAMARSYARYLLPLARARPDLWHWAKLR